jgi:hypothetical protein
VALPAPQWSQSAPVILCLFRLHEVGTASERAEYSCCMTVFCEFRLSKHPACKQDSSCSLNRNLELLNLIRPSSTPADCNLYCCGRHRTARLKRSRQQRVSSRQCCSMDAAGRRPEGIHFTNTNPSIPKPEPDRKIFTQQRQQSSLSPLQSKARARKKTCWHLGLRVSSSHVHRTYTDDLMLRVSS